MIPNSIFVFFSLPNVPFLYIKTVLPPDRLPIQVEKRLVLEISPVKLMKLARFWYLAYVVTLGGGPGSPRHPPQQWRAGGGPEKLAFLARPIGNDPWVFVSHKEKGGKKSRYKLPLGQWMGAPGRWANIIGTRPDAIDGVRSSFFSC